MTVIEAIILGLVQGLTEFLPVSSSGHLVVARTFMEVPAAGVFIEVALHLATLLSVLIVYRERVTSLIVGAIRGEADAWRYIGLLALASVPAGFVGVFFYDEIVHAFSVPVLTGILLLVTGVILWSTRWATPRADRETISWPVALAMGLGQAFAILPGISRSGTSITAGLWGRVKGEQVAEFSFLMSVIAVGGAVLLEIGDAASSIEQVGALPLAVGFITALLSGIFAIRFLVWLLQRQSFYAFAIYLWIVGGLFLTYLGVRG